MRPVFKVFKFQNVLFLTFDNDRILYTLKNQKLTINKDRTSFQLTEHLSVKKCDRVEI